MLKSAEIVIAMMTHVRHDNTFNHDDTCLKARFKTAVKYIKEHQNLKVAFLKKTSPH